MMRFTRLLRAATLLVLVLGGSISVARADGHQSASFTLRPVRYNPDQPATQSYFIYEAVPGQVIQDEVRLTNSGTSEGTVRLYAVDAATGQTSGIVYLTGSDERRGVGSWIALEETELTLAAGEERVVKFSVTVPENARAGDHVGGLVAEDTALKGGAGEGALQVAVQTRMVTAVQIALPGEPVEKLTITGLTPVVQQGYQQLLLGLRNDGNQMVKPSGHLIIHDAQGEQLQRQSLELDTFLPESEIQYPVFIEGQALSAGAYQAEVELRSGQDVARYETTFEVTDEQVAQIFEARTQNAPTMRPTPGAQNGMSPGLLIGLIVAAGIVGGVISMVVMRLRPARRHESTAGDSM